MKIQTPEEIVSELLETYETPHRAMEVLGYAIRKLKQARTLVEPCPDLSYMQTAYAELKSMNFGKEPMHC